MPSLPMFQTQTVITATPAQVGAGAQRLMGFSLMGGSGDSKVEFFNSTDGSGTAVLSANALAATTFKADFTDLGGVEFPTALYCTPTGTAAIVYIFFQ